MSRLLLLLCLAATAAPASAQLSYLPPVDEGAQDASFVAFRSRLLAAAAARDTAAVLNAFSPEATISFGATATGPAGVREVWFDNQHGGDEDLWTALVRTVSMGSIVESGVVTTPYVFLGIPQGLEPFEHVVIVGEQVRIRNAPSLSSGVLTSVTHSVIPTAYQDASPTEADGYVWIPVRLENGERGWVAEDFVWSPVGLRAGFEKQGSTWKILYFVAGD
ncbi:MAG: SH3 domain-containing protein [Bacteroidota bacterium]